MDLNATLRDLLANARTTLARRADAHPLAVYLAEDVIALDAVLHAGAAFPDRWKGELNGQPAPDEADDGAGDCAPTEDIALEITVRELKAALTKLDDDDVIRVVTGADCATWLAVYRNDDRLGDLDDFIPNR